jgi:hypothetical protein
VTSPACLIVIELPGPAASRATIGRAGPAGRHVRALPSVCVLLPGAAPALPGLAVRPVVLDLPALPAEPACTATLGLRGTPVRFRPGTTIRLLAATAVGLLRRAGTSLRPVSRAARIRGIAVGLGEPLWPDRAELTQPLLGWIVGVLVRLPLVLPAPLRSPHGSLSPPDRKECQATSQPLPADGSREMAPGRCERWTQCTGAAALPSHWPTIACSRRASQPTHSSGRTARHLAKQRLYPDRSRGRISVICRAF